MSRGASLHPREDADGTTRRTGDSSLRGHLRLAAVAAVPVSTAVLVAQHPAEPRDVRELAASTGTWTSVHVGLLFAVPLIGLVVWHLLRGVRNGPATVSRVLLLPAVALYAAFDALVGIGTGVLMGGVDHLHEHHHAGAWALAQHWWDVPGPLVLIGVLAPLVWAVTIGAAALAHLQARSPWPVALGLALTAVLFAWGHPGATGVVAMAGLLVAVVVRAGTTGALR